MKKLPVLLIIFVLLATLFGCSQNYDNAQIVATTLPVFEFTSALCNGTDISVTQLVTENVSCLHDYTLQVNQMRALTAAELVVISGAGYESFLNDAIPANAALIDASTGVSIRKEPNDHDHDHEHSHNHAHDPHIWLSPDNAKIMSKNIYAGLSAHYPQHKEIFTQNLALLQQKLEDLSKYGKESLSQITCRKIITFHDGFSYLAEYFELDIIHAIEEESGSEASAAELIELIQAVNVHALPAIFTERNGSTSAAEVITKETGVAIFTLDMAVTGNSYFDAMYHNIDTLKEALQ